MNEFSRNHRILLSSVALVMLLLLGYYLFPKKESHNETSNVPTTVVHELDNDQQTAISAYHNDSKALEEPSFLVINKDKAISKLITKYYDALLNASKKTYDKITVDDDSIDIDVLLRKTEYITGYDNIHIYIAQGTGNIDLIAYVRYDLRINSIQTPAPSIDQLFIVHDNGEPKLYFNELVSKEIDHIEMTRNHKDVLALIDQVNQDFESALQTDSLLYDFYLSLADRSKKS